VKRRAAMVVVAVSLLSGLCVASMPRNVRAVDRSGSVDVMSRAAIHHDKFPLLDEFVSASPCEKLAVPEALATPSPILDGDNRVRITMSFIVGTDGQVHSPLILEGISDAIDREVLEIVRSWRYRPALCNGAPTEAEAKIEFSIR
jgi:TonB family protein